jgi:hypothetical protein
VATCFFRASPCYNETATPFLKSAGGKKLLAVDPDAMYISSERGQTSSSSTSTSSSASNSAATTTDTPRVAKKQKCRLLFNLNSPSTDIDSSTNIESDLIFLFLSPVPQQFQLEKPNRVFAILDTGSLAGNFIASNVVEKLSLTKYINKSSKKLCSVCTGLDNHCHDISDTIELTRSYFCPDLNKNFFFKSRTQRHVILASLILESEQLFGFVPADED